MILGFAHITENVHGRSGEWVPNPPEKWPLMAHPSERHSIELVWKTGRDPYGNLTGLPMEIVRYDASVVGLPSRLGAFGTDIAMRVHDLDTEYRFFCAGLGFTPELGKLYLASTIEHWRVRVHTWVDPDPFAPIDPPLDIAGYAALAFYSSDVEADRDHLLNHGGRTPTEPFTVKLDREMKIVMLRSPEGTIIELIQVMGKQVA